MRIIRHHWKHSANPAIWKAVTQNLHILNYITTSSTTSLHPPLHHNILHYITTSSNTSLHPPLHYYILHYITTSSTTSQHSPLHPPLYHDILHYITTSSTTSLHPQLHHYILHYIITSSTISLPGESTSENLAYPPRQWRWRRCWRLRRRGWRREGRRWAGSVGVRWNPHSWLPPPAHGPRGGPCRRRASKVGRTTGTLMPRYIHQLESYLINKISMFFGFNKAIEYMKKNT